MTALMTEKLTMSSREIAALVESRHDSVKRTIERLAQIGAIGFPPLVENPATVRGGRPGTEYVFSGDKGKRDSIVIVAQLSPAFTARLVDRWQELEQQIQAPATDQRMSQLKAETALFECAASLLNMSESGKVTGLQYIGRRHGLDTGFLPAYVIDAAPGASGGSAMATSSATSLLERHGNPMTAVQLNARLAQAGLIEQKQRARRDGGIKKYWCISSAGLQFGKNLTSPANPRETAPHWYDDRFGELLQALRERAA